MSQEAVEWTDIESLRQTQFGSLVKDLQELEDQQDDLTVRVEALRGLISENFKLLLEAAGSVTVTGANRVVRWQGESKPERKLDPKKLAQAGVTPDQLAKGYVEGRPRKAHLVVSTLERSGATPAAG